MCEFRALRSGLVWFFSPFGLELELNQFFFSFLFHRTETETGMNQFTVVFCGYWTSCDQFRTTHGPDWSTTGQDQFLFNLSTYLHVITTVIQ
jgi:hypothetical protein